MRAQRITTSFLNPLRRHYRSLLPLMPMALESFDLRGYDLVISSESGPAKGVITLLRRAARLLLPHADALSVGPVSGVSATSGRARAGSAPLMAPLANYLRLWDYASAARVDEFIANSHNVRQRIWKTYRREADVIHPPVDVNPSIGGSRRLFPDRLRAGAV